MQKIKVKFSLENDTTFETNIEASTDKEAKKIKKDVRDLYFGLELHEEKVIDTKFKNK